MSTKFKGQRQWIREVLTKFDELGEHQPKPFNESPEWPEWVWNLARLSQLGVVFNYFWLVWPWAYEGTQADFPPKLRLVQTYPLPRLERIAVRCGSWLWPSLICIVIAGSRTAMLDVHFPTTDGRELIFCRSTQPEKDHKMLLAQLGWELPPQSPPRIKQKGELMSG
jgi:hypothetical protein